MKLSSKIRVVSIGTFPTTEQEENAALEAFEAVMSEQNLTVADLFRLIPRPTNIAYDIAPASSEIAEQMNVVHLEQKKLVDKLDDLLNDKVLSTLLLAARGLGVEKLPATEEEPEEMLEVQLYIELI